MLTQRCHLETTEEQITKFPQHVENKMQPLDICFSPLKRRWNKLVAACSNSGPRQVLPKLVFVNLFCSIWHKGLSVKNVISGFKSTGIYSVSYAQYHVERLNPQLLKWYNPWVTNVKPEKIWWSWSKCQINIVK